MTYKWVNLMILLLKFQKMFHPIILKSIEEFLYFRSTKVQTRYNLLSETTLEIDGIEPFFFNKSVFRHTNIYFFKTLIVVKLLHPSNLSKSKLLVIFVFLLM